MAAPEDSTKPETRVISLFISSWRESSHHIFNRNKTHSHQDAVQVAGLGAGSRVVLQQLGQPRHAGQPQDVDVIVAAERLQQREVDLQSDIIFILLIGGEHAKNHAVRVTVGWEDTAGQIPIGSVRAGNVEKIRCHTYAFMSLADS